jgi:hypothetical protein
MRHFFTKATDMSTANTHTGVQQEEDVLPPRLIVYVILGVIAFSLLLVGVAYGILRSRERALRPSGRFPEMSLGPIVERSNVYEGLFGNEGQGQFMVQTGRQSLERFDWVDREKRIVRVPIGTAIELYVNSGAP